MRRRRLTPSSIPLLAVLVGLAALPAAASDWTIRKIALEGEGAPGTSETFVAFDVARGGAQDVAFTAQITSSEPISWAAFRSLGTQLSPVVLPGQSAPSPPGGSFRFPVGFPAVDGAGGVAFAAYLQDGSSDRGVFFFDALGGGTIEKWVATGDAAPDGGTFAPNGVDLQLRGVNTSFAMAFRSALAGTTPTEGLFVREANGSFSSLALEGQAAPGSGSWQTFGNPHLGDGGHVAFAADIDVGGPAPEPRVFLHSGGITSELARVGDPAPQTGGGSFANGFLYPVVNTTGAVAFASELTGGTSAGGYFVASGGGVAPVALEGDVVPDTGGATLVGGQSIPTLNDAGSVAFSALLSGGDVAGAVVLYDAGEGALHTLARTGDPAPDAGGASFADFTYVGLDEQGGVAFVTTLSDGRAGLYLAQPSALVPAASLAGVALMALALLLSGAAWLGIRYAA